MNRRMILYLICQILRIEAVTMIPAAVIAIVQKEYPSLIGFIFAMLAMGGVSLLSAAFRVRKKEIYARDGFLTVSLAWIAVSLLARFLFGSAGRFRILLIVFLRRFQALPPPGPVWCRM